MSERERTRHGENAAFQMSFSSNTAYKKIKKIIVNVFNLKNVLFRITIN